MTEGPYIAEVAALVGDPARANMLTALMDGRAWTAGELAYAARVTPQTASAHLAKLVEARLLAVVPQGRHRYFRLAGTKVATMLEALAEVAAQGAPRHRPPSRCEAALRQARMCYDHLAGRMAVAMVDVLIERGHLILEDEGGEVTYAGARFLGEFGVDLAGAATRRRHFCRPCIDWSERRQHLGGAVGAALAARALELGWVERVRDSRALTITRAGRAGLIAVFDVDLERGEAVAA
jgi:DNA-binding transcriptional ArsR family regulator